MSEIPPTPQSEAEFTPEWTKAVMRSYFVDDLEVDPGDVEVTEVRAAKNEVQGILSVTYVVDVKYRVRKGAENEEEEGEKSIFVKVPLQGEPMHHSVNVRELTMLQVGGRGRS